jgi:hypothetical protein
VLLDVKMSYILATVLQFDRDGNALASNRKVFAALAPVEDEIREKRKT